MTYRNDVLRDTYQETDAFIGKIQEFMADPRQVTLAFSEATAATGVLNWAPGQKVEIINVRLVNGDVAIAASSTTTAFDIDIEDGAGTKTHDLTAKASGTAVAADASLELTMPALADRTVEATELIKCARAIVSTQGECSLVFDYKFID